MRRIFAAEPIANRYPQLMRVRGRIRRGIVPCHFKSLRYRAPGTGEEQAQTPWFWLRGGNPETRPAPCPRKQSRSYPPGTHHRGFTVLHDPKSFDRHRTRAALSLALLSANSNSARFLCRCAATILFTMAPPPGTSHSSTFPAKGKVNVWDVPFSLIG